MRITGTYVFVCVSTVYRSHCTVGHNLKLKQQKHHRIILPHRICASSTLFPEHYTRGHFSECWSTCGGPQIL